MPWDQNTRLGRRGFPYKLTLGVLANHPPCELALPGCTHHATEVDHRVNWQQAMALGWDPEDIDAVGNAQPVCASCHKTKTQAEARAGRARAKPVTKGKSHPGLKH